MKRCWKCKMERPAEEFPWKNKAQGVRATDCKVCRSLYQQRWHIANADKRHAQIAAWKKREKQVYKDRIHEYLRSHPCVDCGESDLVVLHFDHRDPAEKTANVGDLLGRHTSWKRIENEIARCEVRCANCHLRRTARQFGWDKQASVVTEGSTVAS